MPNNVLKYKGYTGSIEFSAEDKLFFGKIIGIKSMICYEGNTVSELENDFHEAVEDYLAMCLSERITPETAE